MPFHVLVLALALQTAAAQAQHTVGPTMTGAPGCAGDCAYCAALPTAIAELFQTRSRTTNLSITNGMAIAIFGGFAPFIATWLMQRTGSPIAPIYLVIAAAILSLTAILSPHETSHAKLA